MSIETAPALRLDRVIRLAGLLLGLVGLTGYALWAANGGLVREGNWIGVDFHVYYQTALVLRRGQDIYHAGIAPPYVYPPLLAMLVLPLAALPATPATILWKLGQHLGLLLAGGLLINLVPGRIRPLAAGVLLCGLLTAPLHNEIEVGESNSLILALLAGALWLLAHRDTAPPTEVSRAEAGAGALLALAVSIKVLPAVLVAYFWGRGPRLVAAVATGGFLLLQALQLLATPATLDYWLHEFPALFGQAFPYLDNQSLNAALARALLPTDPALPTLQLLDGAAWRPALTWLANGLALITSGWVLARAARRSPPPTGPDRRLRLLAEVGLVLLTIHLVSGSTWLHHLIDLAVPLTALLGIGWLAVVAGNRRWAIGAGALVGGALLLLLPRPDQWVQWVAALAPGQPLPAWLASNIPLWVLLALWAALALVIRQPMWTMDDGS